MNKLKSSTEELLESADILLVLARGDVLLDKKGVASATGVNDIGIITKLAGKTESHDGEKEKVA